VMEMVQSTANLQCKVLALGCGEATTHATGCLQPCFAEVMLSGTTQPSPACN